MTEENLEKILFEKRILLLEKKIKDYSTEQYAQRDNFEMLSRNFLLLSQTLKEKVFIQQQLAEQMIALSETIDTIETLLNPSNKIGYDITKEPYN
jgi:hypothetical protein